MKRIIAYKSNYVEFMSNQSVQDQMKIRRVLSLLETEDRIPAHYIKYLEDGIYELRISLLNREVRFLFFYDGATLVVICNCFVKKTQKTPKQEIEKGKRIKKEYYGKK